MTDVLGRYHLLERIGIGGMAEVFLARVIGGDGTLFVVKRMLPALKAQREFVAMFLDEARIGRRLAHENIVAVVDFGEADGTCFTVLDYVDGVDLRVLLRAVRAASEAVGDSPADTDTFASTLPFQHSAWILGQVARGLHFAHESEDPATGQPLGVVHRDVSPANILISRAGKVRIADFGVARSNVQSVRTVTGGVKGKIAYMAPEQLRSATDLDGRADIYSMGVVLWELLTGRRLHKGRNDVQIVTATLRSSPPSPLVKNALAPPKLCELAMRCLSTSPAGRPATALQVAEELERFSLENDGGPVAFRGWLLRSQSVFDGQIASPHRARPQPMVSPDTATLSGKTAVLGDPEGQLRRVDDTSGSRLRLAQRNERRDQPKEVILYVEDERENRDVAELRLRRNYELLLAENDKQACELLRSRGHEISAILMDINLKGSVLNGIDLLHLIRGTLPDARKPPHARGVPVHGAPVIFVTACGSLYSEKELVAAGAQRLVQKPVNFVDLTLALVDVHLKRATTQRS